MKFIKTLPGILLLVCVFTLASEAQENTYPWVQKEDIGIGTSSPAYKLHINGTVGVTAGKKIILSAGIDEFSWIAYDDGNVCGFSGATVLGAFNGNFVFVDGEDCGDVFSITGGIANANKMRIGGSNLTMGSHLLAVNGSAIFTKAFVKLYANWPDYVFEKNYRLLPLRELDLFIKENKHLPNVPTATEVEKDGIDLGANQTVLLKKVEELTLYIIEQDKKIEMLEKQNEQLKKLQQQIDELKKMIIEK